MKTSLVAFGFIALAAPWLVFAEGVWFASLTKTANEGTLVILNSYSLISAILIAIVTSILVAVNARKMKGGVFGTVLNYFSVGMFLVLAGFIAGSVPFWSSDYGGMIKVFHDVFYIIGYILMAVAAHKMFRVIKG